MQRIVINTDARTSLIVHHRISFLERAQRCKTDASDVPSWEKSYER
jgi:hypothetical protein